MQWEYSSNCRSVPGNNSHYVSLNYISILLWGRNFLRGLDPWLRGRDREV